MPIGEIEPLPGMREQRDILISTTHVHGRARVQVRLQTIDAEPIWITLSYEESLAVALLITTAAASLLPNPA